MSQSRFHIPSFVLALPVLLAGASCAAVEGFLPSSNDDSATFVQVDDLLGRIERIHVDCELGSERVNESTSALYTMISPEFQGDPIEAHAEFVDAIERSERQAEDLQADYDRMTRSAAKVFEQWEANLEEFTSESMREHSAKRLEATRERYNAVLITVGPALETYIGFNTTIRDHELYLGTDFNEEAVSMIEKEVRMLSRSADALNADFERCKEVCKAYVRKSATRGTDAPGQRRGV